MHITLFSRFLHVNQTIIKSIWKTANNNPSAFYIGLYSRNNQKPFDICIYLSSVSGSIITIYYFVCETCHLFENAQLLLFPVTSLSLSGSGRKVIHVSVPLVGKTGKHEQLLLLCLRTSWKCRCDGGSGSNAQSRDRAGFLNCS